MKALKPVGLALAISIVPTGVIEMPDLPYYLRPKTTIAVEFPKPVSLDEIISDEFVNAMISVESNSRDNAISKKGARGVMQLMRAAWKEAAPSKWSYEKHSYDSNKSKEVGKRYLNRIGEILEERHPCWDYLSLQERRDLIAAAYNGGVYRLIGRDFKIDKMYSETRNHVRKMQYALEDSSL